MFALLVQAREFKSAAFTQLVSGPDDFPPGPGPYGAAVGTVMPSARKRARARAPATLR